MRAITVLFLLLVVSGTASAARGVNVMDMKHWMIVVAADAIPSEQYAAQEFQSIFKQATGIELPLAAEPRAEKDNVFIGPGKAMRHSSAGFPVDTLGEEGLRIRIKKDNIAIAGGRPRGTLYGVYEFFERHFDVRFLTCDHTYVPEPGTVKALPREDYTYIPQFSFRWSYYKENSDRPDFAARLRVNTVTPDEKLGGITGQHLINHSLFKWINTAKYGESHPEYFAMIGGQRKLDVGGGGPEPCVTNPDLVEIVAEGVIQELDANPGLQNISVSQNDNAEYCRCPNCEAINKREKTPMGAHLMFVNAVAERVEKKHPDVKIGTLAYWYTRQAPITVVPRDNMQIQLCSIECCTLHAIDDPKCTRNQKFCKDMQDWKAISNDIWVWNYNTDFSCYDLPFPNLRAIGGNVKFFLDNNVKGLFMQANGNGTSGEMSDLRNYVIANCIWKPGQKSWPLVEEFCRLHYKQAAQPILDYLSMLHDNAEAKGVHPGCFPTADQVGLTPEIARKALAYFNEALAKADDEIVRARVEKASICAYKAMILAGGGSWKFEDGACRRDWPEEYKGIYDRYVELCQKHNLTMASEGTAAAAYFEQMKGQNALPAVRIENGVWRVTVLPEANGKIIEMLHKPSGRNLLDAMTHADIMKGTHEETGIKGYDSEQPRAFAAETDGTAIKLTKTLADGSTIERRISLNPGQPGAIFFESVLTHNGAEPVEYQFKSHPEFQPGSKSDDANVVSAYIGDGNNWTCFNKGWKSDHGPDDKLLRENSGGAYGFFNHEAGFGVALTYNPAQVDHPYLWWSPVDSQLNLELFTPSKKLNKGENLTLDYQLQLIEK